MKKTIVIFTQIFLMILSGKLLSQTVSPTPSVPIITPGGFFDIVYDKDGNQYSTSNLQIVLNNSVTAIGKFSSGQSLFVSATTTCQAGFFKVFFANGSGMEIVGNPAHNARRTTVCELLQNVSGLLGWAAWNSTVSVNILVDDINNHVASPSTSGILGAATAFYAVPGNPNNSNAGVVVSQIQKTIWNKQDAWNGLIAPIVGGGGSGFYHGMMTFNFSNTSYNWYDNHIGVASNSQYDLYTVIFHEITHALGFASLINSNGFSKFGAANNYYSKFDTYLKDKNHNALLTSTACSSQYGLAFTSNTLFLQPACTNTYMPDYTNCSTACLYNSANIPNMPIYTPDCFEAPSSLSHFEDMCYPTNTPTNNNMYFTMSNASTTGVIKRFLQREERKVLCDLGYSVTTTYTSLATNAAHTYSLDGACTSPIIYGQNDGMTNGIYTYTTAVNILTISITSILQNDAATATNAICVESVYSGTASVNGGIISYTPIPNFYGPIMLRYIPIDGASNQGNITYIFGYIVPSGCGQLNTCNLVQNGGFENVASGMTWGNLDNVVNGGAVLNCWAPYQNSPDLFSRYATGTGYDLGVNTIGTIPPIDSHNGIPNNKIVGSIHGGGGSPIYTETLKNNLNASLVPGQAYQFSAFVYNQAGPVAANGTFNPNYSPVVMTLASNPVFGFIPPGQFPNGLNILTNFTVNTCNVWTPITSTFVFSPTINTPNNAIIFGPNAALTAGSSTIGNNFYTFYDDLAITLLPAPVFSIPSATSCTNLTYTNLAQYTSTNTIGVFSGPYVTYTNNLYHFNSPPTATPGIYPIAFTYTNNQGCVTTLYQNITIAPSLPVFTVSNMYDCSTSTSLVASGSFNSIYWLPNSFSSNTLVVSPVVPTIYTATATYTNGCVVTQTASASQTGLQIAASSATACAGNTVTLSAIGNYTNLTWQPGNFTTNSIVVSPYLTTLYTAVGSNSLDCPLTATVLISVPMPLNVVPSTTLYCAGSSITLTAIGSQTAISWQPGGFTTNSIVVSPTVNTTYFATANFSNGCISTYTYALVSNTACCTSPLPQFNTVSPSSQTVTGSKVINFDLTIPSGANLTLAGEFLIAQNVKIIVPVNAVLNIQDSHLYACGTDMWKGIELQSGGRIFCRRINKDNLIEDAIAAIDVSNHSGSAFTTSIVSVSNTTFNKNYVDVSINNYTTSLATYPFSFSKCVFTCRNLQFNSTTWPQTGTSSNAGGSSADLRYCITGATSNLAPPYLLQSGLTVANLKNPYSSQPSQTAILLNNVGQTNVNNVTYGITIGDASQTANFNLFDSHNTFINANNSNVNSFNNTFQNTKYIAGYGLASAIKCINSLASANIINSKLDVVSPINPNTNVNRFYDCNVGIEARNQSTVNVKYAWLSSTQSTANAQSNYNSGAYGMFIESNRFYNYQVNNSQFLNLSIGIYCAATSNYLNMWAYGQSWGTFSVSANLFCAAASTAATIGTGFMNTGVIVNNSILTKGGGGTPSFFSATPNNGLVVNYNNFYKVWNGASVYGFNNTGFVKTIANNVINLSSHIYVGTSQAGITSNFNNQSVINSNIISGVSTVASNPVAGVFNSQTTNSSAQCNTVATMPRDFEFASTNAGMFWRKNTMSNSGRGMQGTSWGLSTSFGGIGAQGGAGNPSDNIWQGNTWNGTTNLQTWTDANTFAGNSKLSVRSLSGYALNPSWNDGLPTNYSYNNTLYRPIANTNSYTSCTPPPVRNGGTWAGREAHDVANDSIAGQDENGEINQFLLYINLDMDSLLLANDDTLQTFYEDNSPEEVGTLNEIEQTLAKGNYGTAIGMINSFVPESNIQSNFKQFFKLYCYFRTTDSLSYNDNTDLFILANQCPYTDGPAVYKARALYGLLNETNVDYTDEGCAEQGYSGRIAHTTDDGETNTINSLLAFNETKNIKRTLKPEYKIYPNPTIDVIYIKSKNENEKVNVIISDVSGRQLMKENLIVNNYKTDLKLDLLNGIYFVTLINKKGESVIKKLVISK